MAVLAHPDGETKLSQAAFEPTRRPIAAAASVTETMTVPIDRLVRREDRIAFQRRIQRWGRPRGLSRDRFESLGERFVAERLLPRVPARERLDLQNQLQNGVRLVLETEDWDFWVVPLARALGFSRCTARTLEFRGGIATGRIRSSAEEIDLQTTVHPRRPVYVRSTRSPETLSVSRSYRDQHVLLVGGSGFLGKVWLASALAELTDTRRITIVLRTREGESAETRWRELARTHPVFQRFSARELEKVHAVGGDVTKPSLGLDPSDVDRLSTQVDLVVNCAGLTEFNPDPRDAAAVNIDGSLHLAAFLNQCPNARLLHVSTCFVAGAREGRIPEEIAPDCPIGSKLRPEREREHLLTMIDSVVASTNRGAIRARLIERVLERAQSLGWPNIYTYTKAIGEALLAKTCPQGSFAILRPSIVESSLQFPFEGWNEGVNTSAPLSYLLGTAFCQLPANERGRLDIIPVDLVCRAITLVGAALLTGSHRPVYQVSTSATNPLHLRRAIELTALAHRKHYDEVGGFQNQVLARLEAIPVSPERYMRFSVPAQLRLVRACNRALRTLTGKRPPFTRIEKKLSRSKELIELYQPFLIDNEPIFEADNIEELAARLDATEVDRFDYRPHEIDWFHYWVHVHIPALRQWSYPLLEGKRAKTPPPRDASSPTKPASIEAT